MRKIQYAGLMFLTALTFSMTACGSSASKDTSAAAPETAAETTSASFDSKAETGDVNTEDAADYDQMTGLVVKKLVGAFAEKKDTSGISAMSIDDEKIFSGAIYAVSQNEKQPESEVVCVFAEFYYAADPAVSEEKIAGVYNKLLEDTGMTGEPRWEDKKIEKLTVPSGRTLYVERKTQEDCYNREPTEADKAEFEPLWNVLDEQLAQIDLVEPTMPQASADTSFTTVDLDGNPVDSSVFSKAKITMVNIWGSFCSPCIEEMPELMALNEEMEDVQVITILGDSFSPDDDAAEDARDIVKQLGLKLPVYLANEDLAKIFPYQYFPTSYLVDQDGKPVGEAKIGGNTKEAYMAWIKEALDKQ